MRRRVPQHLTPTPRRKTDPLFRIRRCDADRLTERAGTRLLIGLEPGDVDKQIGATWITAQELCRLFQVPPDPVSRCAASLPMAGALHRLDRTRAAPPRSYPRLLAR